MIEVDTPMKISVRLFARAKDIAGTDALVLDLPPGATVADLRKQLASECPALDRLLKRSALAVNDEFAGDGLALPHGAEIALLPPVSGG
jgi:molybdopterin converting factor subunit 1